MSTIQLMFLILNANSKKEIIKLLNTHRRTVKKSKYC